MKSSKNGMNLKNLLFLQGIIVIYTLSGVAGKFASAHDFMSAGFIMFYGFEILILGIYAILWQQIIKKFDLSIAYANRSIALLWSMIWAVIFFSEQVTVKNIFGVVIVIIGTVIVNGDNYE